MFSNIFRIFIKACSFPVVTVILVKYSVSLYVVNPGAIPRYAGAVEGLAAMPLTGKTHLPVAALPAANPAINAICYPSPTRSRTFSKTQVLIYFFFKKKNLFFIKRV